MPTKTVELPDIGPVELVKNRRSRSVKISLQPSGAIRVSLPTWAPYQVAIQFALSRKDWIHEHRHSPGMLEPGQTIGKNHSLYFVAKPGTDTPNVQIRNQEITVTHPVQRDYSDPITQKTAQRGAMRALRTEAEELLPPRIRDLAAEHGFECNSISIRQLKARWGSCSSKADITLNLFLMQLPWSLIDYVLVHELCHTKHLHHGADFWAEFEAAMPDARKRRTQMRAYKPSF